MSPSDSELLKWQAGVDQPRRFDLRAALGPITDVVVFLAASRLGLPLGPAHIVSFCAATVVYYLVKARSEAALGGRMLGAALHAQLLAVSLFALFLRGGVLALLTQVWGWPAPLAILIAVAATMAITLPGYGLVLASPAWKVGGGTRWRVIAIGVVVCAFALRLIYLAQVELLPEEAYYWSYGQHLDLGYLDHPPMVAWLIRLGTAVCGDTAFGVRLGALCCAVLSAFFVFRLTRNLFGEPSALVALVLMQVLPFFFLSGMIMTPDAPLTAAWAATLYFLERALVAGRGSSWWAVGIGLGLGLVSKYTIALLVPAMVVFVILDAPSRRWLWRWEPYAALLVALAIFSPVIIWNAQHEWASFAFQTSRRLAERPRFSLHRLILSVLILLTPTGVLTLLASPYARRSTATSYANGHAARDTVRRWRFIRAATLVPLTVFTVFSLRHEVKIDWTGAMWLAAVPALAFAILS
ncbi:MAG TPA: glycosyltransferase family 39 protein, partial [Steroidobacteraceae bacterium]|nr:glycosyltransferase family 39 protein [Steroidobacteraceae bacterium]